MAESQSSVLKNVISICCMLIATAITVGALLLACGSVVGDIDQNKTKNLKQDAILELHDKEIVQSKLNDQHQAALSTNTLNILTSVNTKLEAIMAVANKQATDIALIQQKTKTKTEGNK